MVGIDTDKAPMQLDGIDQIICETGQRPALDMTSELRLALDSPLESTAALGELIDPNLHSCAAGLVAGGAGYRLVLPVLADPGRGASHPDMANHPLLFHSSLLTALADVGLCALSLAAGCWVLMETGSVLKRDLPA